MEPKIEKIEALAGGKGHIIIKSLLSEAELKGKCSLFAHCTLEPNCSVGYHEHHGDNEAYYIMSGKGNFDDNGTARPVKAGDITFTGDGGGHALSNTGDDNLEFMALIY